MTIGQVIALIKALGGSGSLPSVTSSDNGKVLAVKDGAWAAGTPCVIVTKGNDNKASLSSTEIESLAAAGLSVIYIENGVFYQYYATNQGSSVFYAINGNFSARKTISSTKSISSGTFTLYTKPSNGIPETDLAQAVQDKLNKFVVTLTPTALDYSGTMDKTVAEINAAYEAGQEIVFRVMTSATEHMDVDCTARRHADTTYPSFNGFIVMAGNNNVLLYAFTGATNDGTEQTYSTQVYALTPAS